MSSGPLIKERVAEEPEGDNGSVADDVSSLGIEHSDISRSARLSDRGTTNIPTAWDSPQADMPDSDQVGLLESQLSDGEGQGAERSTLAPIAAQPLGDVIANLAGGQRLMRSMVSHISVDGIIT